MNAQMFVLLFGGVLVAGALLWSMAPRRDHFKAPGLLLDRSSQPALFQEIDAIAAALNEQAPGEVYLVGQPNAFVADRGGILGFGSRRVMGIGLPLLSILSVTELRAVLAHEFAHFYSGDTSLGPWLYRAQSAMLRVFRNLDELDVFARVNVIRLLMVLVSFILRQYFLVFLRVINFISRKQEFRSDELACIIGGKRSAISGLEKIHGAGLAWVPYWTSEVVPIIDHNCLPSIAQGFDLFMKEAEIARQIETLLAAEKASPKTNPFDSHPPLQARVETMERIHVADNDADQQEAMSLITEPLALERLFIEQMNPGLPKNSLRRVSWGEVAPVVTIPAWRLSLEKYGAVFEGKCIDSLPLLSRQISNIGAAIPDPKGMLLDTQQRRERALGLFVAAMGTALIENGWALEVRPGRFYAYRGDDQLDVPNFVSGLVAGKIPSEEWLKKCQDLGISNLPLVGVATAAGIQPAT